MEKQRLSRAEAARINGAKSRGPTSEAGKARSSRNAVRHGLTAKQFMIMPADQEEFDHHLAAVIAHWDPQSDYELYLVTKLARVEFQHDRAENIQNTLVDLETDIIGPEIQKAFQSIDDAGATALGYKSLNDNSTVHRNMDRHLSRLARERIHARKALLEAIDYRRQNDAELAQLAESQPKPEPAPQPAASPKPAARQNEPNMPVTPAEVTPIDTLRRPVPPTASDPNANSTNPERQNEPTEPAGGKPDSPAA